MHSEALSCGVLIVNPKYGQQQVVTSRDRKAHCGLNLTLFLPSNSEWVASRNPSNVGAKRCKVWTGQEKNNKNAHISTVNIAVLLSLSELTSLSSSSIYSESSTHWSSESSAICSLSSSMKSLYPMLQKTNISLNSHHICTDLNIKTTQQEVIEFSPFIRRQFVFEIGFSLAVNSKTTTVEFSEWDPRSAG